MSTDSECLGWDYELGSSLTDEHIRKVGGYKKPKLKLVFAQTSRPENGGIDNIRIPLAVCNQVVGRLIHISDLADRVEGFNAWKMLKNSLTSEHNTFKTVREEAGKSFVIKDYSGPMDWKFGREIRAGDELRFESERLLGYMYSGLAIPAIPLLWGERVPHPLDRTQKSHRFVMYYDASLATMGIWYCHPSLKEAFFMQTQPDFRSFHISALELLTMIWGMWKLGKWARNVGMVGPLLLCAYGDNSSVPLVVHKTFAKSYGMEFIMDLKRWVTRTFDIDVHCSYYYTLQQIQSDNINVIPLWVTTKNNLPADTITRGGCTTNENRAALLELFDEISRSGKSSPMLPHLRHEPLHIHKHLPSVESFHEAGSAKQTMGAVSSTDLL